MRQSDALNILKTGANAFLTGSPGSGKTHTVNAYISWLRERGIEPAITASTGIAATHVGGMTIHSWSGLGIRNHLSGSDLDAIISKEHVVRRIAKTGVLIIDEVSMLSAEVLQMVDRIVREARRDERPFGGLQVILVGDFFQLPPISKNGAEAAFAFSSPTWSALNPLPLYLEEQHRQDDTSLAQVLKNIRDGATDVSDVSYILSRECDPDGVPEEIPRLYTHNADVDRLNAEKLQALKGTPKVFLMESSGAPVLVDALKRGCLSPEALELKEGAVVMFTRNNPQGGYSNGTLGIVTGFSRGTGLPIVETRDGRTIFVEKGEWAVEEGGKVRAKIAQVPLRLAWAITIHKSQGQSLDAAAIDLSRAFEYGQGYVALSRLRTLEGLHLLGWNENALMIHPEVSMKDEEFRDASREAARLFGELEEHGEREVLEQRFVEALGGAFGTPVSKEKVSTYEATLTLMQQNMPLKEIAKERGLTLSTIADHAEKLVRGERISREKVAPLIPSRVRDGLEAIFEAFDKTGSDRLAPVFGKLKKKYTFEELKMARILYDG